MNQSFTCEAGCRIWGFPKSVEQPVVRHDDVGALADDELPWLDGDVHGPELGDLVEKDGGIDDDAVRDEAQAARSEDA